MKKTYSLFITALILSISIINIIPAYAEVLDEDCNKTNNISINKKFEKNYSDANIEYKLLSNSDDEVLEVFNHHTKQLFITKEDIDLMAKLVAAESIGEPYAGKIAVASVVLNRTISPNFPDTIKEVIFQKSAFSCVKNGKINAIANEDCYNAVYDAIRGTDPTNNALFFYNPAISTCSWMKETPKINKTTIGHHTFFKVR